MIWYINEYILFLITLFSFMVVIEGGFQLGKRYQHAHYDDAMTAHVSSLQSALLGLLALLIGFTFAMSISRYDSRKELVVEEANAIGTTYLRAQYLQSPQKENISTLLKSYLDARIEFYDVGIDSDAIKTANKKANQLEKDLWKQVIIVTQTDQQPAVRLLIQSMNDVIDLHEKRQAALENHVPEAITGLLFFVSVFGMGFIGYGYGLTGKRRHISTALFAFLIAVVLTTILDIDRPRRGLIEISQASLVRLQRDLNEN